MFLLCDRQLLPHLRTDLGLWDINRDSEWSDFVFFISNAVLSKQLQQAATNAGIGQNNPARTREARPGTMDAKYYVVLMEANMYKSWQPKTEHQQKHILHKHFSTDLGMLSKS